uniref:Uncharacterized protein n=1 Tax=Oryza nivara TaxID=4536 RepID=A0A0E0IGY8_ORYNI
MPLSSLFLSPLSRRLYSVLIPLPRRIGPRPQTAAPKMSRPQSRSPPRQTSRVGRRQLRVRLAAPAMKIEDVRVRQIDYSDGNVNGEWAEEAGLDNKGVAIGELDRDDHGVEDTNGLGEDGAAAATAVGGGG